MKLSKYLNNRGAQRELARLLSVTPVLVSLWANQKRRVPASRCPAIEKATDGCVTCEELQPDEDWAVLRRSAKEGTWPRPKNSIRPMYVCITTIGIERSTNKVGQVNANTSYSKWFSNQDAAFQKEWLGSKRYKLYTEGQYTLDRFIDPKTGYQYNLDELRQRDVETFKHIFGD